MDATNEICMVSTDSQQCLRNITPWKEYWKITVRVIRMWSSCDPREETDEPAFLHIVVMDKSLNKIQCTLKNVINQFREILKEGELYSISRFTVVPNIGAAKVIKHRYKLLFRFDTEVIPISDVEFPEGSYSLETVESVVQMGQDSVYLIDVMGFLISVRDYSDVELDDGKKFKLMRLALMNAVSQPPIILLQSVKVKIYEGKVVVQNVIDCTKIMINPDIPEAICFITRLDPSESYFIDSITLGNGFIVADVNDDFDGFFNVVAKIKSICNNFDWWSYSCVCGYPLELFRSHFSCSECGRKIKNAVKKYKVLVDVEDATRSARFVVYATPYPPFFDDVIGKEVVFKVDRKKVGNRPNVGTFKVVNCSDDHVIVNKFKTDPVSSRLLPPTVFSPIYEDVIQNPQPHDEISSLGSRISVTSDNMESIEVDMEALGAAYNLTKPDPCILLASTITSISNDRNWWYSVCLCGEKIDADQSKLFCHLCLTHCSDGFLRYKVKVYVNHAGGCNALILHDGDVQHLMGRKCSENEEFHLDASDFLYKLIGKKLVFMVDPQPVESDIICPAYNVFKVSTHEFMLKLIERLENRALNAHKSIRVVNEIVCNKRLASPYRDVPRSTKQKLEDVFSRSIDETWNDNEEASSSMNI
ncbi:hypothetical protein Ahy_B10g103941 [Arachis hypogaea]|uniref:Replication protein A 70 kDa DNA-binding subunit B/D first OB fold domain-containing protein n=1 Tax=Arachis hypogaea TaxID=3818 RepID=A0A444X4E0_ARAHY|nr:hypothetical protein Ahy_B10g103941 [Arachis hypogaea]